MLLVPVPVEPPPPLPPPPPPPPAPLAANAVGATASSSAAKPASSARRREAFLNTASPPLRGIGGTEHGKEGRFRSDIPGRLASPGSCCGLRSYRPDTPVLKTFERNWTGVRLLTRTTC